jgi:tRNA threonylcarbamoyl adenosine modification protein YjeE
LNEFVVDLPTRRATTVFARCIAKVVRPGDLYVLAGPLGAGKTFLVRAVCRALGLDRSVRVTSPTFTLVHEYPTVPPVLHADVYRVDTSEGVEELGLVERRDQGNVLFVEWGGAYVATLGGDAVVIELSITPRRARIRATGPGSAVRAEALHSLTSELAGA